MRCLQGGYVLQPLQHRMHTLRGGQVLGYGFHVLRVVPVGNSGQESRISQVHSVRCDQV